MKKTKYKIAVVGIGYVGLIVALNFGKKYPTIGFDVNTVRIKELNKGFDLNQEVSEQMLKKTKVIFSADPDILSDINCYVITAPTLLTPNNKPNLSFLKNASINVAKYLKKDDIIVYESTVFPGATEEILIPILEKTSGLKSSIDFFVGYSPERINAGDGINKFSNIRKIISGQNKQALDKISHLYQSVLNVKIHRVKSIKIAEAAKLVENAQRDINIAFTNELALIFNHFNIDIHEVIKAAKTKWNFVPFEPGLVGGHCINISSHYLAYKAKSSPYHAKTINACRKVNESLPRYIVKTITKKLKHLNKKIDHCRVGILGLSYKENTKIVSNSPSANLARLFMNLGADVLLYDPKTDPRAVKNMFNLKIHPLNKFKNIDALIIAVAHKEIKKISEKTIKSMLNLSAIVVDLKCILNPAKFKSDNIILWRF